MWVGWLVGGVRRPYDEGERGETLTQYKIPVVGSQSFESVIRGEREGRGDGINNQGKNPLKSEGVLILCAVALREDRMSITLLPTPTVPRIPLSPSDESPEQ